MDIHIVIKDDVLRGVVTSMLLAVVGGFFFIITQSAREGVTFWLYKHFPNNRGKLYVMATSRGGSYLSVLGILNLMGGLPMFIVLLVMIFGALGSLFSGLVVGTKNEHMDLCTSNGCFSTGIGKNILEGYANITTITPEKSEVVASSMGNFALQSMNNTITAGLPWSGPVARSIIAANVPPEIHQIPLERLKRRVEYTGVVDRVAFAPASMGLEYANGTFLRLTPGVTSVSDNSSVVSWSEWNIYDNPSTNPLSNASSSFKNFHLSTATTAGVNLLLMSSIFDGFGDITFKMEVLGHINANDTSYVKRATYYGLFVYMGFVGTADATFQSRGGGLTDELEFSKINNVKVVKTADQDALFNATLDNLRNNTKVLSNHTREMQTVFKDFFQTTDTNSLMDFTSYIMTCVTMAVSQTRPIGMIKGYEQAGVVTPIISIKLVLAIPLLLATIAFFIPYAIVAIKLYTNNDQWLPYKLHVDAREYIINLCHSRFIVSKPISDDEFSKVVRKDHGDDGPVFELEKLVM